MTPVWPYIPRFGIGNAVIARLDGRPLRRTLERLFLVAVGRLVLVSACLWQNVAPLVDMDTAAYDIAVSPRPRRPFLVASVSEAASYHADTREVGLNNASDALRAARSAGIARLAQTVGEVRV